MSEHVESSTTDKANLMGGASKGGDCRRCQKGLCYFCIVAAFVLSQLKLQTRMAPVQLFAANEIALEPYTCPFRDYESKPDRFYGLTAEDYPPPFLRSSFYIYSKAPILLPLSKPESGGKVCSRLRTSGEVLEMDGTNPSLLSFDRLRHEVSSDIFPWKQLLAIDPTSMYLVSSTFKRNNQCTYFNQNQKGQKTHFRSMEGRLSKDADLLIVDSNIQTLWQTHIFEASTFHEKPVHYSADDVRIFVHDGEIWMSYKRYEVFGKAQRINRLRFEFHSTPSETALVALADSREEIEICCGRNFGALSRNTGTGNLSFLTWPDPVWLQELNTRELLAGGNGTRISFTDPDHIKSRMPNKKASDFHGTSNQLLYIPEWDEYLCIGHIHRERKWALDPRRDAAYGHHYTHAFFTISGKAPHMLKRLSQEFLFPSNVPQFSMDADVVQFASGLEWVPSSTEKQIAIGYGINDCEGAVVTVEWSQVESMLVSVNEGSHVAQNMRNVSRDEFVAVHRGLS